jgi:large subunit ribosomal protein L22e
LKINLFKKIKLIKTMVKLTQNPVVTKQLKMVLDLGVAYEDDLIVSKEFLDFLKSSLKVNGKKGNLGEDVTLLLSGSKITVTSKVRLSKRYLKYLTKKYLKKSDILEYLKVIATDKQTYKIKYVKLDQEEGEENKEEN